MHDFLHDHIALPPQKVSPAAAQRAAWAAGSGRVTKCVITKASPKQFVIREDSNFGQPKITGR
jgi:hypothetical protein